MIELIKNRSDIGAGTRGADMGIDAMEIAAINRGDDYFNRHHYVDVKTHNETIYNKFTSSFAKRIEHVYQQCERVCMAVSNAYRQGNFPVVLSGDHSSALGTIAGIMHAHPGKTIGVIWLDAHADIHSPYTSPSGNVHGMPLAAALKFDNLNHKVNEVEEDVKWYWERMKSLGGSSPKVDPAHLIYLGLRDFEAAELQLIKEKEITHHTVSFVREQGIQKIVGDALRQLSGCDLIYISFDVDSMDCDEVSYGTGTPVPTGFYVDEIMQIFDAFLLSNKITCIEFAEINPLLDNKGNRMAETAFQVLAHISRRLEK
ncbi:arginase [Bacteroidota bacterium]|nr:arginase [Bacteroidota bacterium]